MPSSSCRRGFTLIELMIAMAALAILAGVALPAFHEQVARTRRVEMQAALLEDAAYMQHYYASHDAFTGTPPPQLPWPRTPRTGATHYAISVAVPASDPASFVLTAQRAGVMAADACGDFSVDSLGQRNVVAGSRDAASCWR